MARKKEVRLGRKSKGYSPRAKILIVCEGEQTEKDYFEYLRKKYGLTATEVIIKEDGGSSPNSVFKDALELYQKSLRRNQVPYDTVYCVYDKDEFSQHAEVKNRIEQQKDFNLIFSNPCFEVWYLFHYGPHTKPFMKKGTKTSSQQVKSQVNKLLKKKGNRYLEFLFSKTDEAIKNSKSNIKQHIDNPYTNMFELVEKMQEISKKRS